MVGNRWLAMVAARAERAGYRASMIAMRAIALIDAAAAPIRRRARILLPTRTELPTNCGDGRPADTACSNSARSAVSSMSDPPMVALVGSLRERVAQQLSQFV